MLRTFFGSLLLLGSISHTASAAPVKQESMSFKEYFIFNEQTQKELGDLDRQIAAEEKKQKKLEKALQNVQEACKDNPDAPNCRALQQTTTNDLNGAGTTNQQLLSNVDQLKAKYNQKLQGIRDERKAKQERADARSRELDQIADLDKETRIEFAEAGLSAQSLVFDVMKKKERLADFERKMDNTRMALYMEKKLQNLMNSSVFCDAAKQCASAEKGKGAVIPNSDLHKAIRSEESLSWDAAKENRATENLNAK